MGGLNSGLQYRENQIMQGSGHLVGALGRKFMNEVWFFFFVVLFSDSFLLSFKHSYILFESYPGCRRKKNTPLIYIVT